MVSFPVPAGHGCTYVPELGPGKLRERVDHRFKIRITGLDERVWLQVVDAKGSPLLIRELGLRCECGCQFLILELLSSARLGAAHVSPFQFKGGFLDASQDSTGR